MEKKSGFCLFLGWLFYLCHTKIFYFAKIHAIIFLTYNYNMDRFKSRAILKFRFYSLSWVATKHVEVFYSVAISHAETKAWM